MATQHWAAGDRVHARWHKDEKFYPAVVVKERDGKVEIKWEGGNWLTEKVAPADVKKPGRGRERHMVQPMDDPKKLAFQRLSSQRKEKAIKLIKLMENFRNLRAYEYTADEADQLCNELDDAVGKLRRRLLDALDD